MNDDVRASVRGQAPRTYPDIVHDQQGPLWYRGLALEPDTFAPQVDEILAAQKARAIVVGHSIVTGAIGVRFNGRVFLIDTGMQPSYVSNGKPSALEITGQTFTAIYPDRREVLAGGTTEIVR